jgi:acetyl-CoA synthetase
MPEFFNFGYDVVDAWAAQEPDKTALLWVNQHGEEKRYGFSDMKRKSDLAARLLHDSGILKSDRVFIMLPRIPEWWILIVGLIKLGAVYTPAPTLLTSHDIAYRLSTGRFAMVITDLENALKIEEAIREESTKPECSNFLKITGRMGNVSREDKIFRPPPDLLYLRYNRKSQDGTS